MGHFIGCLYHAELEGVNHDYEKPLKWFPKSNYLLV